MPIGSIIDLIRPGIDQHLQVAQNEGGRRARDDAIRAVNASAARSNANPTALARSGARAAADTQARLAAQFAQQRAQAEAMQRQREGQALNQVVGTGLGVLGTLGAGLAGNGPPQGGDDPANKKLLSTVGGVAGMAAGGPVGAAAGSALGGVVGGAAPSAEQQQPTDRLQLLQALGGSLGGGGASFNPLTLMRR